MTARRTLPSSDVMRIASADNLARAFKWTLTNTDRTYRKYFRDLYQTFALVREPFLSDLRERLTRGEYEAHNATKLFYPKPSGILRPLSLLRVEDQVVYQAAANVIAEKLAPKVYHRYGNSVFGHLYAGKSSPFFYRSWKRGYSSFTKSIRASYREGFEFSASFDLTAFYDSIDHNVLCHFLETTGLDLDFCQFLRERLLRKWTPVDHVTPITQGHGIPQGPQPSGLLAEVVLQHLDSLSEKQTGVRYFRYVDDIRLLGRSELSVRRLLIRLDLCCKELGLFPQSGKIHLHRISDIEAELKTISNPPETAVKAVPPNQKRLRKRILALTPRLQLPDQTRFKYVLAFTIPDTQLSLRLLDLAVRYPHLSTPLFDALARSVRRSKRVSDRALKVLREQDLYASFTAGLLGSLSSICHPHARKRLADYAAKRLRGEDDPALRVELVAVLMAGNRLKYGQIQYQATWRKDWWARSRIARLINIQQLGPPSAATILDALLCDPVLDCSLTAADLLISEDLPVNLRPLGVPKLSQIALRAAGRLGRVRTTDTRISEMVSATLGSRASTITWQKILGGEYKRCVSLLLQWSAHAQTNATGWINLTDVFHDILLNRVYGRFPQLGKYSLGNIGGVLSPTGRLASDFPKFFAALSEVHRLRLESGYSHAVVKHTQKATRFIKFREISRIKKLLLPGYLEVQSKW